MRSGGGVILAVVGLLMSVFLAGPDTFVQKWGEWSQFFAGDGTMTGPGDAVTQSARRFSADRRDEGGNVAQIVAWVSFLAIVGYLVLMNTSRRWKEQRKASGRSTVVPQAIMAVIAVMLIPLLF